MANALREVSVSRGHDPREFVFYAYGGTLPWFAAQIAAQLDIGTVLIPHNSSVFCARGLLTSDFVLRQDKTIQSMLIGPDEIARVNAAANELVTECRNMMRSEGFSDDEIQISRSADFQFAGQVHALEMSVPNRDLTDADVPELQRQFHEVYERTYGKGTAWPVPPLLLNCAVTATGKIAGPRMKPEPLNPRSKAEMRKSEREVYMPTERRREVIPVYDEQKFSAGSRVEGPALVESVDTTLLVPRGVTAERDALLNVLLHKET
jgi:N-methylhydantoinase A